MRIPRTFPSTKQLIFTYICVFSIIFVEVYYCHYLDVVPYFITFQKEPYLSPDKSHINFIFRKLPKSDTEFTIIGYGVRTRNTLSEFCEKRKCSIPFFIGGFVNFTIFNSEKVLYAQFFDLPKLNFSCSSPNWEDRTCYARNVCFNVGIFAVTSPFSLEFDSNLLTLGSKAPPTDYEEGRLTNRFKSQYSLPQGIPYLNNSSFLMSIFYHLEKEWSLYFDFLLPAYFTLTNDGYTNNFKNHHLVFPYTFCDKVPHLINSLSNHRIICLNRPFCFEELTFGMLKMTNYKLNDIDPPYDFPNRSIESFKSSIYDFFNINYQEQTKFNENTKIVGNEKNKENEKNNVEKSRKIVFLNRKYSRIIMNSDNLFQELQKLFPNDVVSRIDLEMESIKDQILATRDVDVLIGMHGSGLANILWMKKNSTLLEIFPYKLTCKDWLEKACKFLKINYLSYHPESDHETIAETDETLTKCYKGTLKCSSSICQKKLLNQNTNVSIENIKTLIKKSHLLNRI